MLAVHRNEPMLSCFMLGASSPPSKVAQADTNWSTVMLMLTLMVKMSFTVFIETVLQGE